VRKHDFAHREHVPGKPSAKPKATGAALQIFVLSLVAEKSKTACNEISMETRKNKVAIIKPRCSQNENIMARTKGGPLRSTMKQVGSSNSFLEYTAENKQNKIVNRTYPESDPHIAHTACALRKREHDRDVDLCDAKRGDQEGWYIDCGSRRMAKRRLAQM